MQRVVSVRPLDGFQLEVRFEDGVGGVVALESRLFGPMFAPRRDPAVFREALVDEFRVICWPNGANLAPDALYEQVRDSDIPATRR